MSELKAVLDLTKPVTEQSDAELAATLQTHSNWACLREIGEGREIRAAQEEAAARLTRHPAPLSEENVEVVARAIFEIIWPLQEWDGEERICRMASKTAARAAILALSTTQESNRE